VEHDGAAWYRPLFGQTRTDPQTWTDRSVLISVPRALGKIQHLFRDFDVLDLVEVFGRIAYLIRVAQQNPHQAFVSGLQRDDTLADAPQSPPNPSIELFLGLRIGIVTDLPIGHDVVRPHQAQSSSNIGGCAIDAVQTFRGECCFSGRPCDGH
jgi:hypothetical protein